MNKISSIFSLVFISLIISCSDSGCGDKKTNKVSSSNNSTATTIQPRQFNISVLLDLSNRLIQPMVPSQSDRDIQIVKTITNIFKKKMESDGAYRSKSKLRILFSPEPADPSVNTIAKKLSVDLSKFNNPKKKEIYDSIENDFETALRDIYNLTLKSKKWIGSDIWRFFKRDAFTLCVDPDTLYRNILVILTDGYLDHVQSRNEHQKHRTGFINGPYFEKEGLRNANWKTKFDNEDYGLISSENVYTYPDLEILVLEINPPSNHIDDEEIIRAFLFKWFSDMKVKNPKIYNTALPINTQPTIENYFNH